MHTSSDEISWFPLSLVKPIGWFLSFFCFATLLFGRRVGCFLEVSIPGPFRVLMCHKKCSRWAMRFIGDKPWTHHCQCGTHLTSTPTRTGPWDLRYTKLRSIQKKRDYLLPACPRWRLQQVVSCRGGMAGPKEGNASHSMFECSRRSWCVTVSNWQDRVLRLSLKTGLQKMLGKWAITWIIDVLLDGPGFYSSLLLVEKRSGGWRPILNSKSLNLCVVPPSFWMDVPHYPLVSLWEDIHPSQAAAGLENTGLWAVSLDLEDPSFYVAIDTCNRKYLSVCIQQYSLRVPGALLWPLHGLAEDVHSSGEGLRGLPQDVQSKSIPLSGQLACGRRVISALSTVQGTSA